MGLDRILVSGAPAELVNIASQARGSDINSQANRLLELVGDDSSKILGIIRYLDVESGSSAAAAAADSSLDVNDRLKVAAKLLYRINPKDLTDPGLRAAVKKVETAVRNNGLLNHEESPDLSLTPMVDGFEVTDVDALHAHKSILALESDYFRSVESFEGFKQSETTPDTDVLKSLFEYLYLSDNDRKAYVKNVDREVLPHLLDVANAWNMSELAKDCEQEICSNLRLYTINKNNIDNWIEGTRHSETLNTLLQYVKRVAQPEKRTFVSRLSSMVKSPEDRIPFILEKINDSSGFEELVKKCTPEEIEIFRTLNMPFGKFLNLACNAAKEWSNNFGIKIDVRDMPPIPSDILMALERNDAWEPHKSISNQSTLFYLPKEIGNLEQFSKILSDRNIGKLEMSDEFKVQQRKNIESRWVLIRDENIPKGWFHRLPKEKDQRKLMEIRDCRLPTLSEGVIYSFMTLVREGRFPYERIPLTRTEGDFAQGTACKESYENFHTGMTKCYCISPNSRARTLKVTYEEEPNYTSFGKTCVWNDLYNYSL